MKAFTASILTLTGIAIQANAEAEPEGDNFNSIYTDHPNAIQPQPSSYPSHKPVHHEYHKTPVYNYGYDVSSDYHGVSFGANENRNGHNTAGQYRVLLPDGRIQTVTYSVDGYSGGYQADVQYEGEAKGYGGNGHSSYGYPTSTSSYQSEPPASDPRPTTYVFSGAPTSGQIPAPGLSSGPSAVTSGQGPIPSGYGTSSTYSSSPDNIRTYRTASKPTYRPGISLTSIGDRPAIVTNSYGPEFLTTLTARSSSSYAGPSFEAGEAPNVISRTYGYKIKKV